MRDVIHGEFEFLCSLSDLSVDNLSDSSPADNLPPVAFWGDKAERTGCKSSRRGAGALAMSAALSQKKQAEGEECMRAAAKALKTSAMSFKFRPDWETACAEYEKAVTCFKASTAPYCRLAPIAASD